MPLFVRPTRSINTANLTSATLLDTTDAVKPYLRAGQLLSLESTTYPGTTEEELLPRVEENWPESR